MKIPKTFYIWLKPKSAGSNKCHIVTRFVDHGKTFIVYKNWNKKCNCWEYYIDTQWLLNLKINHYKSGEVVR